ncbi:STAS/SEC14 domain-containing protein [Sphingomonas sp. ID1715]|uniref:STAS/SEC14 domain-containing protein n=1 Tax=Sphingomonas sp. ID1715 TaxID=1656898 RepID=UPI0014879A47|nr:STAS/SEC14 domain-containing protein [Sphingomonas sp. ID1715]NNM77810.1 STAS/SEC14 domain-containing protein [Sphingomonas sp. ID1715]
MSETGWHVWVELSGDIIVARLRGDLTESHIADVQAKVLVLLGETERRRVLYDALEMDPPSIEMTVAQQQMSEQLHRKGVRVAILVPNTRIAYLARIAFGQGDHRVFYNDLAAAVTWLTQDTAH